MGIRELAQAGANAEAAEKERLRQERLHANGVVAQVALEEKFGITGKPVTRWPLEKGAQAVLDVGDDIFLRVYVNDRDGSVEVTFTDRKGSDRMHPDGLPMRVSSWLRIETLDHLDRMLKAWDAVCALRDTDDLRAAAKEINRQYAWRRTRSSEFVELANPF